MTIALLRTERRYDPQFYTAVEYVLEERDGTRNFSAPFPHVGLRIGSLLADHEIGMFRGFVLARLASTATQETTDPDPSKVRLSAERVYGLGAGFAYYPELPWSESPEPYGRLQIGLAVKAEAQTVASRQSALWKTFYGVRLLHSGRLFNGTFLEAGFGESPQFLERRHNRLKVEGFLPIEVGGLNVFLATGLESDVGAAPDQVTFSFGTFFAMERVRDFFFGGSN